MAQQPLSSLTSPAAMARTLWQQCSHRPLLAMALFSAIGCALGFTAPQRGSRAAISLDAPLTALTAAILLVSVLWLTAQKERVRWAQLALALAAVTAGFAVLASRRLLPPPTDVCQLVRNAPFPRGPQQSQTATLQGWVASSPQNSDFGSRFPLAVHAVRANGRTLSPTGFVSVDVPPGINLEVGDAVAVHAEITDLPRTGNRGERGVALRFLEAQCWCLATARHADDIRLMRRGDRYPLARMITALSQRLPLRYERSFTATGRGYPHATAQLLTAIVFGIGGLEEPLPQITRDAFRASGLSHVLVASGTQCVFLLAVLLGTARLLGIRRSGLLVVVLPALLLYALVAGDSASIWRATIGGACIAWALLMGRETDGLSLWSLAFIVLLLLDPMQLHDIGFQLSFAATWGLLVLAPAFTAKLRSILGPNAFIEAMAISVSAQAATIPLLLYHFGRISFAGLGTNLVAVPLAGTLVGTGLLGLVFPPANAVNYLLVGWLQSVAYFAAHIEGASASAMPVGLNLVIVTYVVLGLTTVPHDKWVDFRTMLRSDARRWWKRLHATFGNRRAQTRWFAACVFFFALYLALRWSSRDHLLRVSILDVGQGESIVIRGPTGRTAIIDGGTSLDEGRGEVGRAIIVPYLQSLGVRRVDFMFLSHADSDHCNGLKTVSREVPVGLAIDGAAAVPGASYATEPDYLELRDEWRRRGIRTIAAAAQQKYDMGDGAILTVLAPLKPLLDSDNNNCAVIRLDYGKTSFLFTGDIEAETEERLLKANVNLACTVLKVGHHGSPTSTSEEFLRAAAPRIAVISCGRYNSFGHPSPQVLERLARNKVATFRTDRDGAIEITSNGDNGSVQTNR